MIDPAVLTLAEPGCRDQHIAPKPQGLNSQAARALADMLLCFCRHLVTTLYPLIAFLCPEMPFYPSHARPPYIGYHRAVEQ